MSITLTWVGPYTFGHFGDLSQYPDASKPHVYITVRTFHSRKIAAVSKAANLSSRINEHLRDFLGRQCYLSDEDQGRDYGPALGTEGEGLAVFDSIDEWLGVAAAEVKRFGFYAAPCDNEKLDDVEAELSDRLWKAAQGPEGSAERESERSRPSGELILKYQFSTPDAMGVLEFIPEPPAPEPKRLDAANSPAGPPVYTYSAPGMPMCPRCGQRPAIFYCTTHQSAVCLECVAKHDDRGACVYVPAFRAPKPATGQTATSQPAGPQATRRSQSILGID